VYDWGAARRTLRIDLANIAGTPGASGRYAVSETYPPDAGLPLVGPVAGELRVENIGSLLLLRGRLRARLRLACVRCLAECERSIDIEVEEQFSTEATAPDVDTMDRDEPEASAISDYVLDVTELVRQHVAACVPMAFVCRPECAGLCPRCGANLNEGPCACPADDTDARWGKLKELLPEQPDEDNT